jgi:putative membrane protein
MNFHNRLGKSLATLAGSALLCGVTALAQTTSPGMPQPGTSPGAPQSTNNGALDSPMNQNDMNPQHGQTSPNDRMFVKQALEGGMAEVQLGQLALQKSNNADVKQFAQRMVDDHTRLGEQMKPIAQQIGVKIPDGPSKKDKALIARMQALNGDDFDKAYVKDMVKDHKADLNDFKTEAQNGSDPKVKAAATQGSQVIQQHLEMIQQIAQKDNVVATK